MQSPHVTTVTGSTTLSVDFDSYFVACSADVVLTLPDASTDTVVFWVSRTDANTYKCAITHLTQGISGNQSFNLAPKSSCVILSRNNTWELYSATRNAHAIYFGSDVTNLSLVPGASHYFLYSGTVTLNTGVWRRDWPLAGDKILITSSTLSPGVTVSFTTPSGGNNYIINYTDGSNVTDTITIGNATVELTCATNGTGAIYYYVTGSYMSSKNSFINYNGTKLSSCYLRHLPDVNLALNPSTNDGLVFDGTNWVNAAVVNSWKGRTGAVTPASGDYTISQITNASTLANSANVTITSPSSGQYLKYNGSVWINDAYYTFTSLAAGTTAAVMNTSYYANLFAGTATLTMPTSAAVGDRLRVGGGGGGTVVISFPTGSYILEPNNATENITITGGSGYVLMEFYVTRLISGNPIFAPISSSGIWNGSNGRKYGMGSIANLIDSSISSLASNQVLRYNGTNWANSTDVLSWNTRTGAVTPASGDYTIAQITNASTLASSANVTITSPATNQALTYNGTVWVNAAIANSFNGRTGAVTPAANDYNITQLAGVSITSAATNEVLRYNGTAWADSTDVISFNSRTGAVTPAANDYNITQLAGVSITSPASGQQLTYNGTNWVNATDPSMLCFNSQGNLTNALYFRGGGTGTQVQGTHIIPRACTVSSLTGWISATNSSGIGWTFTLYKNGATTGLAVTLTGTTSVITNTGTIAFAAQDRLQVLISSVGSPVAATGACTIEMY